MTEREAATGGGGVKTASGGRDDFLLRAAEPRDVPAILALIRDLAEYERLTHLLRVTEGDLHEALFGGRPAAEVVLAEADGDVAAFALFFHNYSTFLGRRGLYLEDLFVRPAFRRRGIGRALLAHLAGIATARRCGRFEWSVLDWNEPAIRFYESLGATVMPDWRIARVTGDALVALATPSPRPGE
jgi:GNAT superfamily N-acetyltransferase